MTIIVCAHQACDVISHVIWLSIACASIKIDDAAHATNNQDDLYGAVIMA